MREAFVRLNTGSIWPIEEKHILTRVRYQGACLIVHRTEGSNLRFAVTEAVTGLSVSVDGERPPGERYRHMSAIEAYEHARRYIRKNYLAERENSRLILRVQHSIRDRYRNKTVAQVNKELKKAEAALRRIHG